MQELIFGLIGGLGLFLFGMKTMSEGLERVASNRLRNILRFFTKTPPLAVLTGAGITALIQSSSAMMVMLIGFVNAGLLTLGQGIGVMMGAEIGTSFTAWLVSISAFKITAYALPTVGIGFALNMLARTKRLKLWGQVLLGFGVLFLGLVFMKDAFAPLKESQVIKDFFVNFSRFPILGILAGMLITAAIQSSSAAIATVQILALQGLISFDATIPLIFGSNIGTTITAQIASVGTNLPARQIARAQFVFNVLGVAFIFPLVQFGLYAKVLERLIPGSITLANVMVYIAVCHTSFNVFSVIVGLFLIRPLEKIAIKMVPSKRGQIQVTPQYLEEHLLNTPAVALKQSVREMVRMITLAREALNDVMTGFLANDQRLLSEVAQKEDIIDAFQEDITNYLVKLSERTSSQEVSEKLPGLIHSVNDIERIGDHAENLAELAERKIEERLPFTEQALAELKKMFDETDQMTSLVISAMETDNEAEARLALKHEDILNRLQIQLRESHIQRLQNRECWVLSGVVFLDFVNNLEKVGDHLKNISLAILQQRL
ncbi:TPA: Na/Pi cotransporter family protein [Candidatus Poribacteria bacterium]|nr:Na/Pi cotransporter family protein [Candidatus Poribacteria bacterium]